MAIDALLGGIDTTGEMFVQLFDPVYPVYPI
jgi:hypothetical protein